MEKFKKLGQAPGKRKLKKLIQTAVLSAGISASALLVSGCYEGGIGPQIDFGENIEEVNKQMTVEKALVNSIADYLENEILLQKFIDVPISCHEPSKNYNKQLSNEEKQINIGLKQAIKDGFVKDMISSEMPFTVETFNKRCDKLGFNFGNFVDGNTDRNGFIHYPDISIALAQDGYPRSSYSIACTIIHELGHALGIQLESMTKLFQCVYSQNYRTVSGVVVKDPIALKSGNKKGDNTELVNKYDVNIETALLHKVGVKKCFRAALTSPKAVRDLWNNDMGHTMEYDKIKMLNDNINSQEVSSKAFGTLDVSNPRFFEWCFIDDASALLFKIIGLSEHDSRDPKMFTYCSSRLFYQINNMEASMKVYAFDNPLLKNIELKNKKDFDKGGFLITRDLTNEFCKQGLKNYENLFNTRVKSVESLTTEDSIEGCGPPIELER